MHVFQLSSTTVETKLSDIALCLKVIVCSTYSHSNDFVYISNLQQHNTIIFYYCEPLDFIALHLTLLQEIKPSIRPRKGASTSNVREISLILHNHFGMLHASTSLLHVPAPRLVLTKATTQKGGKNQRVEALKVKSNVMFD